MSTDGLELDGSGCTRGLVVPAGWNGSVFPVESQDSMSAPVLGIDKNADAEHARGALRGEVCSEATSGWTRRVRLGRAPDEREMNPDRKTALELSVRAYAEKGDGHVVDPKIGILGT